MSRHRESVYQRCWRYVLLHLNRDLSHGDYRSQVGPIGFALIPEVVHDIVQI